MNLRNKLAFFIALNSYVELITRGTSPLSLPKAIAGSLSYAKAFGGTEQRNLPDGYTQLEYIESTGTQYIDTGVVPTQLSFENTEIFVDGQYVSVTNSQYNYAALWGTQSSSVWFKTDIKSESQIAVQAGGSNRETKVTVSDALARHQIKMDSAQTKCYVDGTAYDLTVQQSAFDLQYNITLFKSNGVSSSQYATARIYGMYIKSNDSMVRNFIPAKRNSDNVIGMYDLVSGQFFTNAGTGTFTAGADAVPTPDKPIDIVSNNGVIKVNSQGQIYTDGTVETINVHGKNILDPLSIEQGTISGSTGEESPANNRCRTGYIKMTTGDTVCITVKNDTPPVYQRLYVYDSNKDFLNNSGGIAVSLTGRSGYKYTAAVNCYVRFIFLQSEYFTPSDIVEPQLEYASAPTDYEPYFNGGTAIAEMLLKVDDYQDVQSIIDGVVTRNVGVKVLDGTETMSKGSYGTMGIRIAIAIPGSVTGNLASTLPVVISHYQDVFFTTGININNSAFFAGYSGTNGGIFIRDDSRTEIEDMRQFLAGQYAAGTPVIVVYPLATPTTETVTGQPMQTVEGDNTVVITQASLNNLELEAKYKKRK